MVWLAWAGWAWSGPAAHAGETSSPPVAESSAASRVAADHAVGHASARHGLLFEIRKNDRRAFVFGTLHVGKADVPPIDDSVMESLGQVARLAVEVDITRQADMLAAVEKRALYPSGQTLADDMSADERAQLDVWLAQCGMPHAAAVRMRPWMLEATLTVVEAQRQGFSTTLGADLVLIDLARAAGKSIVELESIDQQFDALAAGSPREQVADLLETVAALRSGEAQQQLMSLVQAWNQGDAQALARLQDSLRADPRPGTRRMLNTVVLGRNRVLARQIDAQALQAPLLAAVGALHLVGPDSVLSELLHMGWSVEAR